MAETHLATDINPRREVGVRSTVNIKKYLLLDEALERAAVQKTYVARHAREDD
ncbi:hypothetical protein [Actinoplanes sp. URMC 104]|uniref:hypothetical protein n=1 Tax=Actinoplanes sp. URMC 104 TaxID=3423409 RepID=UPI003F1DC15A